MLCVVVHAGIIEHLPERIHISGPDLLPCCLVQPAGGFFGQGMQLACFAHASQAVTRVHT